MTWIGLDLNATRARAVHGPGARIPAVLRLEGDNPELPLALSLEDRPPSVGRAGTAICRSKAHLACMDFLPHLGTNREWGSGRHRVDASKALGLVLDRLVPSFGKAEGVAVALPTYLTEAQRALLTKLVEKARCRPLGTVAAPVAAALAAYEQLPWSGLALVVDLDGHALTWSAVEVDGDRVELLGSHPVPQLARGIWLRRLLDGAAHRCVRLSRRDPRESADAEQSLYDQLAEVLEGPAREGLIELAVQTSQWYQNLMVQPDELVHCCAPLVKQALEEMQRFLDATGAQGPVAAVLATAPAGRLPGLAAALEERAQLPAVVRVSEEDSDFGASLMEDEGVASAQVHVLEADAVARATHGLAARLHRGDVPRGHHFDAAPLPAPPPADTGPARLHFRGKDHLLAKPRFILGRDPACDLVFETELYPTVSTRHCEVLAEQRGYVLRDRSRHGTLVNDRPVDQQVLLRSGDWIRLGPAGPVLRFLGQSTNQRRLMTTA